MLSSWLGIEVASERVLIGLNCIACYRCFDTYAALVIVLLLLVFRPQYQIVR
jgi:hypothetical protein